MYNPVIESKEFRVDLDNVLQRLKGGEHDPTHRRSRERSLAITKVQEAIMWLGMDLKALKEEGFGGENPYPDSYNTSNTNISPTADGLRL